MDLNNFTECLLDLAISMTGAYGGRIMLQKGNTFILTAESCVADATGTRAEMSASLPYEGVCRMAYESGSTLHYEFVGNLASKCLQKIDNIDLAQRAMLASPICDESGSPVGVLLLVNKRTANVRSGMLSFSEEDRVMVQQFAKEGGKDFRQCFVRGIMAITPAAAALLAIYLHSGQKL